MATQGGADHLPVGLMVSFSSPALESMGERLNPIPGIVQERRMMLRVMTSLVVQIDCFRFRPSQSDLSRFLLHNILVQLLQAFSMTVSTVSSGTGVYSV